ncbi:MAG: biopolymer transporter ExbD [Chroococcus sp. CMT-3BRIN-NPC107]|jgi:biopolymer transport protein ExbD|nr:biopolymer transporter ExbD [Chroococcus sp. CMT-3BRIN-NPC107]
MNVPNDDSDSLPEINLTPMIDVVFAILTFFILASLFLTRSEGLPVNLPSAKTATQQSQTQSKLTVTMDKQGKVLLDRQPVEVRELAERVKALKGNKPELLVVINADRAVEHGQVITVMDELRTVQGVKLGVATQRN